MNLKKTAHAFMVAVFVCTVIGFMAGCGKTDTTENKKQDSVNTQKQNTGDETRNKVADMRENQKKDVMKTTDSPDNPSAAIAVVRIPRTSCDKCKDIITEALKKIDGVGDFTIDSDRGVIKIKFDMSKTDISKIETGISAVGFDANDKKADPEAFKKLDDCCKQPGGKK